MVAAEKKQVKTEGGKVFTGEVVSDKMDKTVVVKVVRMLKHPFFGKVIRRHKKYKVHDEQNTAKIGDTVEIKECRPLSKEKYMTLVRVLPKS
jgi:small subunit ribosomal protein S17